MGINVIVDGVELKNSNPQLFAPGAIQHKGVFETLRTYNKRAVFLSDHIRRSRLGLKKIGLSMPVSDPKLIQYVQKLIDSQKAKNIRLRLSFWECEEQMHFAVCVMPLIPISIDQRKKGYSVMLVHRKQAESSEMSEVKSLEYSSYLKAFEKAKNAGYDEALLVNQNKHIYEGSRTNLFLIVDDTLITPTLNSGCLNGIVRRKILTISKSLGFKVVERFVNKTDVFSAQEAFLSNSIIGLLPIHSVNDIVIGDQTRIVFNQLFNSYQTYAERV